MAVRRSPRRVGQLAGGVGAGGGRSASHVVVGSKRTGRGRVRGGGVVVEGRLVMVARGAAKGAPTLFGGRLPPT